MNDDIITAVRDAVRNAFDEKGRTPWFDSDAAADYLTCTPGTMKTWRSRGEGPAYHVVNGKMVRYHIDDLDAFVRGEVAR
jgi:hypothetical protein